MIGLVTVALVFTQSVRYRWQQVFGLFQGIEAAMNITVLTGAALFFLWIDPSPIKRRRALDDLHVFRSIAHVIDMHQLTKDPSALLDRITPTASSPARIMDRSSSCAISTIAARCCR